MQYIVFQLAIRSMLNNIRKHLKAIRLQYIVFHGKQYDCNTLYFILSNTGAIQRISWFAISFRVVSLTVLCWLFPLPSNCFNNSPALRYALNWIRLAYFIRVSSFACLAYEARVVYHFIADRAVKRKYGLFFCADISIYTEPRLERLNALFFVV